MFWFGGGSGCCRLRACVSCTPSMYPLASDMFQCLCNHEPGCCYWIGSRFKRFALAWWCKDQPREYGVNGLMQKYLGLMSGGAAEPKPPPPPPCWKPMTDFFFLHMCSPDDHGVHGVVVPGIIHSWYQIDKWIDRGRRARAWPWVVSV